MSTTESEQSYESNGTPNGHENVKRCHVIGCNIKNQKPHRCHGNGCTRLVHNLCCQRLGLNGDCNELEMFCSHQCKLAKMRSEGGNGGENACNEVNTHNLNGPTNAQENARNEVDSHNTNGPDRLGNNHVPPLNGTSLPSNAADSMPDYNDIILINSHDYKVRNVNFLLTANFEPV